MTACFLRRGRTIVAPEPPFITRRERGQLYDGDAQAPSCYLSTQKGSSYDRIHSLFILASRLLPAVVPCQRRGGRFGQQNYIEQNAANRNQDSTQTAQT